MSRAPHPRRDEGVERLRTGESAADVAQRLKVSPRTVEGWARTIGRSPGQRGPDRAPRAAGARAAYAPRREPTAPHQDGHTPRILELLASGEPPAAIARLLGISASAVRQARARHATELAPAQDPAPPPARRAGQR